MNHFFVCCTGLLTLPLHGVEQNKPYLGICLLCWALRRALRHALILAKHILSGIDCGTTKSDQKSTATRQIMNSMVSKWKWEPPQYNWASLSLPVPLMIDW
jgi:hypothetical protein